MADPYKPRAPFAPWDRRELPGLFDVEESARRVGNYKGREKLFEAGRLGGHRQADVKMRRAPIVTHACHAELWHKRCRAARDDPNG